MLLTHISHVQKEFEKILKKKKKKKIGEYHDLHVQSNT